MFTMNFYFRGIDYMLQAKLADARAQEAEQKLEGLCTYVYVSMRST